MTVTLGRLPEKRDPRTLRLANFVEKPRGPLGYDLRNGRLPVWRNDAIGCCTVAATAGLLTTWRRWTTPLVAQTTDAEVIARYKEVSGYDGTAATDRGAYMLDVLKAWRARGFAGAPLSAYLRVDADDHDLIRYALAHCAGVYVGADLPASAQRETLWRQTTDEPRSWGGHSMAALAYDRLGYTFATWGKYVQCTRAWWDKYVDEVYVLLSPAWFVSGASPKGFDAQALQQCLQQFAIG